MIGDSMQYEPMMDKNATVKSKKKLGIDEIN